MNNLKSIMDQYLQQATQKLNEMRIQEITQLLKEKGFSFKTTQERNDFLLKRVALRENPENNEVTVFLDNQPIAFYNSKIDVEVKNGVVTITQNKKI